MIEKQNLLFEIGCEELPPKALLTLSNSLQQGIESALNDAKLTYQHISSFAAPRRLAILIKQLDSQQADQDIEKRGPALQAAYDQQGNPTKACQGFAKSCQTTPDQLRTLETSKGSWVAFTQHQPGKAIAEIFPDIIQQAIKKLPIPKPMRWGNLSTQFIRPVHWICLLYGDKVIETNILGLDSGRQSYGHRFHHPQAITIQQPTDYEQLLLEANVMVCANKRAALIKQQATELARKIDGVVEVDDTLLQEVSNLVEWPVPLLAEFPDKYLDVPAESLITAMQSHQKCFPIRSSQGNLLANFITVSNIESENTAQVINGNQRVMCARLADAEFFYHTDLKTPLENHLVGLKDVIFQAKLGSLYDKTQRITQLASHIATIVGANQQYCQRAAELSKTDLLSDMVGEFPELQGIMGYYYAKHHDEPSTVAQAIKEHYLPKFSGDQLPETLEGCCIAIADRLDTLVAIFGINQAPTGDKDPFGLRRAALGLVRLIIEKDLAVDLKQLLQQTLESFQIPLANASVVNDVWQYAHDRMRSWYAEQGIGSDVFAAVLASKTRFPADFHKRIQSVTAFCQLPEAKALAAANKRVKNILTKQAADMSQVKLDSNLLQHPAEQTLAQQLQLKTDTVATLYSAHNYQQAFVELATLRPNIDAFFDDVMVMVDDDALRQNRLALLASLFSLFSQIADISLLQSL